MLHSPSMKKDVSCLSSLPVSLFLRSVQRERLPPHHIPFTWLSCQQHHTSYYKLECWLHNDLQIKTEPLHTQIGSDSCSCFCPDTIALLTGCIKNQGIPNFRHGIMKCCQQIECQLYPKDEMLFLKQYNTTQLYCQVSIQLHKECFVVPSTLITHSLQSENIKFKLQHK